MNVKCLYSFAARVTTPVTARRRRLSCGLPVVQLEVDVVQLTADVAEHVGHLGGHLGGADPVRGGLLRPDVRRLHQLVGEPGQLRLPGDGEVGSGWPKDSRLVDAGS